MEVEITQTLSLSDDDAALVDMHSILNILNVIHGEISILGMISGQEKDLHDILVQADHFTHQIRARDSLRQALQSTPEFCHTMLTAAKSMADTATESCDCNEICESLDNLQSISSIFIARAAELVEWLDAPMIWRQYKISDLHHNIGAVFAAIEKNSRGRFHIVFNIAQQDSSDYMVDVKITSDLGDHVWMPPVFQDVFRDLLANARKYTQPGGEILAGLHQSRSTLKLVVEDTGLGIPENEITKVIQPHYRGTNATNRRTMGCGLGLTKAYAACKRFNGRLWIRSRLGHGTRVTILIPVPSPIPSE